jgi:hypothetical protein
MVPGFSPGIMIVIATLARTLVTYCHLAACVFGVDGQRVH